MIRLVNTGARYGSALGFVGLATALTTVLQPFISATPVALFFGAVALGAWSGGLGPGLMATALSVFCINFFFHSVDVSSMLVFSGIAALISYLVDGRDDAKNVAHNKELQLQRVFDSITEMAFTVDSNWRFIYINKQLSAFTDKSPDYYQGKSLWEELPALQGEQGERYEEKCREAMATGQNQHFEVKSDFDDRWWQVRAFPHNDQLSIFVSDITEAKCWTQSLIDREEQLRLALMGARMGDWEWDVATDEISLSERFNEIFGFRSGEQPLTLTEFLEIVHPLDRPAVQTKSRRSVEEKTDYTFEYRAVWPDESIHWVHARGRAFYDAQGQPVRMRGVVLDITDQKRVEEERAILLENERQARNEAERVSRMKDEFLATLSHELRTPLNAILGWSQLIRESRLSEAEKLNGISTIERNARLQVQLIEDLLDMSRIISGKMRLDVQRVYLATIIEGSIESVQPAASAKGIRLQTVLDPTVVVNGDSGRLQQVVWNLLTNAIKFTPKEGRVQVCLARINSHVEIVVTDSGQGIKPEFLPYVFERFRQEDSSTTRRFGGLGLGLGIVHHLVQSHGGSVIAQSPGEGQGAAFTVKLPLVAVRENDGSDLGRHPDKMNGGDKTDEICVLKLSRIQILVVDDEPDSRELLKRILIECEAQVVTASCASEALELIAQEKFDVLISDIGMPGEDGYQLMRQIRQYDNGNDANSQIGNKLIPAIALTAYARIEDRRQALLAGFNLHLAKPIEPSELITAVASLAGLIR